MCLLVDKNRTEELKEELEEEFYVYKILQEVNGNLQSPLQKEPYTLGTAKRAEGHLYFNFDPKRIDTGAIHCCLTLEDTRGYRNGLIEIAQNWHQIHHNHEQLRIVKCLVKKKDFIAIGRSNLHKSAGEHDTIVFTTDNSICFSKVIPMEIVE